MKPLATLNRPVLETVDVATGESTVSFKERTDVTAVPALGVISEAMMALVLANEAQRKVRRRLTRGVRAQSRRLRGEPGLHGLGRSSGTSRGTPRSGGLPGVGKSTLAKALADSWKCDVIDTDERRGDERESAGGAVPA